MFAIYSKYLNDHKFLPFNVSLNRNVIKKNATVYSKEETETLKSQIAKLKATRPLQSFQVRTIQN